MVTELASERGNAVGSTPATAWNFHQALIDMSGNATMSVVSEALHRISQEHSMRYMEDVTDPEVQQTRAVRAFEEATDRHPADARRPGRASSSSVEARTWPRSTARWPRRTRRR